MRCWLGQFVVARRLDEGGELPAWVRRHLDHCVPCRGRYQQERRLLDQLAVSAQTARAEPPPFLRARILAHARPAGASPFVATGRGWGRALVVAGGTLALALVLVFTRFHSPPGGHDALEEAGLVADWPTALTSVPTPETVLTLSTYLDAPLAGEWTRVMADARTALTALSRSFLPSQLADISP
jgi:predicted anti-sigma-YlaC factor YlaD